MTNKVIIGILIFLVILVGGLCFHSYTLSTQIGFMNTRLTAFQEEQAAQLRATNDELANLRLETASEFGILRNEIQSETQKTIGKIETLEKAIDENVARTDALEQEINSNTTRIETISEDLKEITAQISPSVMNAKEVYQKVRNAAVRISDGETIRGSGFIFDDQAHILTAQHVINNLSTKYVVLPDGRIFTATVVGSSPHSDIAVLKVRGELGIEPLQLADSSTVSIGEPVATIGNPFALTETLTTGIISQKDRYVEITGDSVTRWVANLIQFDAAVNFGNSGCPLVNSEGKVVGMVIARVEPNEGDGINYAVSSNKIKRVSASLIAKGYFDYPWLGVNIVDLTPQIVQSRGLQTSNGVLVKSVSSDSPAKKADIKTDDIILTIDGITLRSASDLTSYLGENKSPGEMTTLTLLRGTAQLDLSVQLGKLP